MNTCAACKTHSNLAVKLPKFVSDEKLAFVERVCGLLIESRFSHGRADAWAEQYSSLDTPQDDIIRELPRFAWPAAAYRSGLPSALKTLEGFRSLIARSFETVPCALDAFSVSRPARGSPR